jgi:transposase
MAMGKRKQKERQEPLWIASNAIVETPGHAFYDRLNGLLGELRFDRKVEHLCRRYYRGPKGRPSIAPGTYFRMLLIGYFEGLDSERGIAWRVADSLSLRKFLGYGLDEPTPDHSTISRTRRLYALSTHKAVFAWVLERVDEAGLLGKTVSIDATPLEANAAMRTIVRRDTGASYEEYVKQLAIAAGLENPTREQLARFDRKRKKKKTSNDDWEHPHDPDARITKMKDGRTRLAHKVEHAVDASSGALRAIAVHAADCGDTTTIFDTLAAAEELPPGTEVPLIEDVIADKGYHSDEVLVGLHQQGLRSYISEPDRGRRRWQGKREQQARVYENRRRLRGDRNGRLQRKRGELGERSFAHMYETGGMRHLYLRGRANVAKRLLVHGAGFNLGLVLRVKYGFGKPRSLQGLCSGLFGLLTATIGRIMRFLRSVRSARQSRVRFTRPAFSRSRSVHLQLCGPTSTTGC